MTNLGFRLAMEPAASTSSRPRSATATCSRPRRGRLLAGRRAERARHLPRPGHHRRRAADGRAGRLVHRSGAARRPRCYGDDAAAAGAGLRARRRAGARRGPSHGRRHQRRRGDARGRGAVLLRCSGTEPLVRDGRGVRRRHRPVGGRPPRRRRADRWGVDGAVRT